MAEAQYIRISDKIKLNMTQHDFVRMRIDDKIDLLDPIFRSDQIVAEPFSNPAKSDSCALTKLLLCKEEANNTDSFRYNILVQFNKSLATARTDSMRSMVFYERGKYLYKHRLYKWAEIDFERALVNSSGERRRKTDQFKRKANALQQYDITGDQRFYQEVETTSSIKMEDNTSKQLVATRDIDIGEVVLVEPPVNAIVCKTGWFICQHCFDRSYAQLTCDHCTQLFYCSVACKTTAWENYHKYMCPIIGVLTVFQRISPSIVLALKMAIEARHDYTTIIDCENGDYPANRLGDIWQLAGNLEETCFKIHLSIAYLTVVISNILKKTSFYEDNVRKSDFVKVFFMSLFANKKNLTIAQFYGINNTGGIMEVVGCGLYRISRYFKHSCCPNLAVTHHGSTLVLRALKSIKIGEQCSYAYKDDCVYYKTPIGCRREYLQIVEKFICNCRACIEYWPWYNITMTQVMTVFGELIDPGVFTSNIPAIRDTLTKLLKELRKIEDKEPTPRVAMLQMMIEICYKGLGNLFTILDV